MRRWLREIQFPLPSGTEVPVKCVMCDETVAPRRWDAGYHWCMPCGEREARKVKHCIVPMHKSNYVVIYDKRDLMGINNKGGFYR